MRAGVQPRFARNSDQPNGVGGGVNKDADDNDDDDDDDKEDDKKTQKRKARTASTKAFFQSKKVWILAIVIVIFLILGVLIAVVLSKSKKAQHTELLLPAMPHGGPVPAFVGGENPLSPMSSMPEHAWYQSASVAAPYG